MTQNSETTLRKQITECTRMMVMAELLDYSLAAHGGYASDDPKKLPLRVTHAAQTTTRAEIQSRPLGTVLVEAEAIGGRAGRRGRPRQPGGEDVSAVPLTDARELAPFARRTLIGRTALVLAAAAAAAAFLLWSRNPQVNTVVPFEAGANTVVVVDLSASINNESYLRIGSALAYLVIRISKFSFSSSLLEGGDG